MNVKTENIMEILLPRTRYTPFFTVKYQFLRKLNVTLDEIYPDISVHLRKGT